MFTIWGCSPKRSEICSCTHVPEIQCTHVYYNRLATFIWFLTLGLVLTFPASSSSFAFVLLTCLQRQTRCAHCDCNLQTDWHLAISLKHCSHDWETNKTLSTWYSVKFMGIWDHWPLWTFTRPGVRISHHLPVSIQSLVVELSWTIAETKFNMALWTFGMPGQLWQTPWVSLIRQAACGDENFRENRNQCSLKRGAF